MNRDRTEGSCIYPLYPPPQERSYIRKMYSNTAWALILSEVIMYILSFISMVVIYACGYSPRLNDENAIILDPPMILSSYTSVTFALIIVSAVFGRYFHFRLSDIFGTEKLTLQKVFLTVVVSLGAANICYVINIIMNNVMYMNGYELASNAASPDTPEGIAADVIASVLLAPVFEEIFYRGIIMRSLCRVSKRFAIFASALVFGLIHGNPMQLVLGFVVGIVFGYADIKTDSVIPSMIAHMAINAHLYIYDLFTGEYSDLIYLCFVGAYIIAGTAALLYTLKKYGLEFPRFSYYHKQRTLPVIVRSLPVWVFVIYSVYTVIRSVEKI